MNTTTTDETRRPDDPGSFASLVASLAEVAPDVDADPAALPAASREEIVAVLAGAVGRLDAFLTRAVGVVDDHGDWAASGSRSVRSFVASRSELAPGHVGSAASTFRRLRELPVLFEAWLTGVLGSAKIRLLLAVEPELLPFLQRDQAELVEGLAPLTVAGARARLARWREAVLAELDTSPDDPEPEPEPPVNSVRESAGVGSERMLHGIFDALTGAEISAMLAGEIDRAHAAGEFDREDGKTLVQRQADALLALLRRGSRAPVDAGAHSSRPAVTVNIRVDLAGLLGLTAGSARELLERPCETADGTIVPLSQVLERLDDATINLVLGFLGREGVRFRPVGEISTRRLADASQRRMLRARDRSCRWPGCDSRATWAKAHHEPPWERTHRTVVTELVLLCPHHHRLRHHHGYRFELGPDGDLIVIGRDHRRLAGAEPDHKVDTDRHRVEELVRRRVDDLRRRWPVAG